MSKKPIDEWQPPVPPHDKRLSSQSSRFSHGSFHNAEVGEAVPVPIKRSESVRTQGSVKYYEGSRVPSEAPTTTDEESMYSEHQVKLGRLNTRVSQAPNVAGPSMTLNTEVEDVHAHRFSVNITDDLDKLMENASSLRSEPLDDEPFGVTSPTESHYTAPEPSSIPGNTNRHSTFSSGSFETADSGEGSDGLPQVPEHTVGSRQLPKRPSPQSLEKARVASHQFSLYSREEGERTLSFHESEKEGDAGEEAEPKEGMQRPHHIMSSEEEYGKAYEREFAKEQGFTPEGTSDAGTSGGPSRGPSLRAAVVAKEAAKEEGDVQGLNVATGVAAGVAAGAVAGGAVGLAAGNAERTELEPPLEATRAPVEETNENTEKQEPGSPYLERPQAGTLLAKSDPDIVAARDSVYTDHGLGLGHDDEYYDIEEPVVVNPVRAKSVKDNIQMPKRKSTKRKPRKNVRSGSGGMKPFSYNTLINLLESINGAVIGEEFETLSIPIKEKQMIEKIVDSLSRLTSDMILDEQRYEIGLERLEKAHRVLEGFM
ncbi:uncharacterized protein CXQ87_000735 [Candidozyma duobushaemuli]|uniref:Protein NBA1 n=1 Tax=Candidozyma duobushaemuli TaxID=1231522 RepID=A0A2V1AJV0_9ASCO|nr:uncharacterized protein CXQ87_000735 [[Candida] duobushaemulonis]PVH17836.1 hypothetical protein CXQ87_000735 [[Candida] duobushaemulonis]